MAKPRPAGIPIGWERALAIFGHPRPPKVVREQQFDGDIKALWRLARTPHEQIDFSDLSAYYDDLNYVELLQPDLFAYLFPACLMHWHDSLRKDRSAAWGLADFHQGIRRGQVFEKLVTPEQRAAIHDFFRDSFLERLDAERGFIDSGSGTPAYAWISRFNSVGQVMPRIDLLWEPWWRLETPGRAVAALQYCSDLMYFEGENPLFNAWTKERGGGGPCIWANDSHIHEAVWMDENIVYLTRTLTVDFVKTKVVQAVARLSGEPECEKARRLEEDLEASEELISLRVAELPQMLGTTGAMGWSD